jgi:hypothetical protein
MGASSYSHDVFTRSVGAASSSAGGFFDYTTKINSGTTARKVHEDLDPSRLNKEGKNIRESRDSSAHPNSNSVAVIFDVTGSMSSVPKTFVTKLNALMSILVKKGYLSDPQILFGAVGDAFADSVPLQIGQFESGEEQVDVLTKIFLEGGGGGSGEESYELAMYYLARHTSMDCLEKRGKKGYLFLLGDENIYSVVSKSQIKRVIGDDVEADIPLQVIVDELREKFEVFWIMPAGTSHYNNSRMIDPLVKLFGQNFLKLSDANDVSELIASTIGISEGFDIKSIEADIVDAGSSAKSAKNATTALSAFVATNSLARKTATVSGALVKSMSKAKRL